MCFFFHASVFKMVVQLLRFVSISASIISLLAMLVLKNYSYRFQAQIQEVLHGFTRKPSSLAGKTVGNPTKFILDMNFHAKEGSSMFKECPIKECYFTGNPSYFGPGNEDHFDAVIIAPLGFRRDQVTRIVTGIACKAMNKFNLKVAQALINMKRRPNQRYIMRILESPRYPGFINKKYFDQ